MEPVPPGGAGRFDEGRGWSAACMARKGGLVTHHTSRPSFRLSQRRVWSFGPSEELVVLQGS